MSLATSSGGDIRAAINALQFACLNGERKVRDNILSFLPTILGRGISQYYGRCRIGSWFFMGGAPIFACEKGLNTSE
jgi:hypothetical protein